MEMLAGTSGYSYKEWLGRFYPEASGGWWTIPGREGPDSAAG
jgi:uncharacterized protein YecE (DUF72 family)